MDSANCFFELKAIYFQLTSFIELLSELIWIDNSDNIHIRFFLPISFLIFPVNLKIFPEIFQNW